MSAVADSYRENAVVRAGRPSGSAAIPRIPKHWGLTESETRVVALLATGLSTREIARALGLSVHTIRTHEKRAMAKSGAHTQASLVARVFAAGA